MSRTSRYQFKHSETIAYGIKRVVLEQIDKSIESLDPNNRNKDRGIHQARVCFKKIRAAVKLVKSELGPAVYEQENRHYRDAGRRFSAVRDTVVVARFLDEMVREFGNQLDRSSINWLRKHLLRSKLHHQLRKKDVLSEVTEMMKSARMRVETWPVPHNHFSSFVVGLQGTYKRGRRSYDLSLEDPRTENMHEWRKQVKYLWYQLSLLHPVWPKMLDMLSEELSKLAHYLNENHDLALLKNCAIEQIQDQEDLSRIQDLIDLTNKRQIELQTKAVTVGARLYAEKPGDFTRRFGSYWDQWRPPETDEPTDPVQTSFASLDATFAALLPKARRIDQTATD